MARVAEASAPSRIDLAGGTLDIWPLSILVPGAVTLNVAVELRAWVRVTETGGRVVRIVSRDRRASSSRRIPLDPRIASGPTALLERIVASFAPGRALRLECRAEAPAGAGLGGSSALAIAAASALLRLTGKTLDASALVRRVMNVEALEIGVPTGGQDYLAAVHGGLSAWTHGFDGTRRGRIAVPRGLEERLVLAYAGEPRRSGASNWQMFRRFIEGDRTTRRALESIARVAGRMRDALRAGDLDTAGRLVGEEGDLRYRLAPAVATPGLLRLGRAAAAAGALGTKVCGAGGGGCLVAFAKEGRAREVASALSAAGGRVLPVRIARRGVVVGEGARGGFAGRGVGISGS